MIPWDDALSAIRGKGVYYIDIETTGFDFLSDEILSIQIAFDSNDQYVLITAGNNNVIPTINAILEEANTIVGHNLKFDLKFLMRFGLQLNFELYDTMLGEQVINNGTHLRAALDSVVQRHCSVSLDKSIRQSFTTVLALTYKHINYAADDVKYLKAIMKSQVSIMKEHDVLTIAKLECKALKPFIQIEFNGLLIDTRAWRELLKQLKDDIAETTHQLDTLINTDDTFECMRSPIIQLDMFTPVEELKHTHIEWSKPMQVLKVAQCVDKKIMGTSEADLFKLTRTHPVGSLIAQYRTQTKKHSSFGEPFLKHVFSDGKIHPRFNQIVRTGRVSCKEPNMQQIPADNKYRNCFVAPEGYVFVSADYSSQELCIIAKGSNDPVFNFALEHGHDLHSVCAALVFGDDWRDAALESCAFMADYHKCECPKHKEMRNAVKSINFGLAYGMGPRKLSDKLEITMDEASSMIEKYFKAFPSIKQFLESNAKLGVRQGYITTMPPWNRKRWFPEWKSFGMSMKDKSNIERLSKNTPIQGAAADMTKHALVLCDAYIREHNSPAQLVMTVHDQIDTICPAEYAEEWADILKSLMESAAQAIMKNDLLKAEVTITEKWSK